MTSKTALQHRTAGYDAADVERPAGERWVTMSNALTRAGHGLTLAEKRVVMMAVSKLDSMKVMRPGEMLPSVKITAAEYAETYGVDPNTAYEALQDAAKNLFELKRGKRVLLNACVFHETGVDAQGGYALVLKSDNNGSNSNPVPNATADVQVLNCWIYDSQSSWAIQGNASPAQGQCVRCHAGYPAPTTGL